MTVENQYRWAAYIIAAYYLSTILPHLIPLNADGIIAATLITPYALWGVKLWKTT